MDFRLTVFIEVARLLSFTRAARKLQISQPAISKHIRELESQYGVKLFERSGMKVALTREGLALQEHARAIAERYRLLQADMDLFAAGAGCDFTGRVLRLGAPDTVARQTAAPLAADFRSRFPGAEFSLLTGSGEEVIRALAEDRIDLGWIAGGGEDPELEYAPFVREVWLPVCGSGNPGCGPVYAGAAPGTDSAAEGGCRLCELPLVLPDPDSAFGREMAEVLEAPLAACGLHLKDLRPIVRINDPEGIREFLLRSPGSFSILPVLSVKHEVESGRMKALSVAGPAWEREIRFAWRRKPAQEQLPLRGRTRAGQAEKAEKRETTATGPDAPAGTEYIRAFADFARLWQAYRDESLND